MNPTRLTLPDVVDRFASYRELEGNGAWGSLHCVLEDGNVRDHDVRSAIEHAKERSDSEGVALGAILLAMTQTQRLRIPHAVERLVNEDRNPAPGP